MCNVWVRHASAPVNNTTVKDFLPKLWGFLTRTFVEWRLILAALSITSLWYLPPHIPTESNWLARDEQVLVEARRLADSGALGAALATLDRFVARRKSSQMIGEAHFLHGEIRFRKIRTSRPPDEAEIRTAEASYRLAVRNGFSEEPQIATRRSMGRWLANRGLYVMAFNVHDELMADRDRHPEELLDAALLVALAVSSGRFNRFTKMAYAYQLLDDFDLRTAGDPTQRPRSEPIRARILAMEDRLLPEDGEPNAMDTMDFALVENDRGAHLTSYYLERGRIYKTAAQRFVADPDQRRWYLTMAGLDLDRSIKLGAGFDRALVNEARYHLGETYRLIGDGRSREVLKTLANGSGPTAAMAALALGRTLKKFTGRFSFDDFLSGFSALESRGPIERFDLDLDALIGELETVGREATTPERVIQVTQLLDHILRLYPERLDLLESNSNFYLKAARMLRRRQHEERLARNTAGALRSGAWATRLYETSANIQLSLSLRAGLDSHQVMARLGVAANRLYEGGKYKKAAERYHQRYRQEKSHRFALLMTGLALKQGGVMADGRNANSILSEFVGSFGSSEALLPNALLLLGDVLTQEGNYPDAIQTLRQVQGVGGVGPKDADVFWSVKLELTEGIQLDPAGRFDAQRAKRTYWGESFIAIGRAAYLWARLERKDMDTDPTAMDRRRTALEEGRRALDEFRERYLQDYEAGTAPPPPDALAAYHLLALFLIEEGKLAEADVPLDHAVEIGLRKDYAMSAEERLSHQTAHYLHGDVALSQGDFAAADVRYNLAIRRFPNEPKSMFARIGLIRAAIGAKNLRRARAVMEETLREWGRVRPEFERELEPYRNVTPPPPGIQMRDRWELELNNLKREIG